VLGYHARRFTRITNAGSAICHTRNGVFVGANDVRAALNQGENGAVLKNNFNPAESNNLQRINSLALAL